MTEPAAVPGRTEPAAADPAALPPSGAPLANVANALTMLRLLLVPGFGVMLLAGDGQSTLWRIGAAVTFAVASVTDQVDGLLARRRNLITSFGIVADPIADKALIGTALVALSVLGELPWWVTVLVLAREVGVTLLRFWVIRHGDRLRTPAQHRVQVGRRAHRNGCARVAARRSRLASARALVVRSRRARTT